MKASTMAAMSINAVAGSAVLEKFQSERIKRLMVSIPRILPGSLD